MTVVEKRYLLHGLWQLCRSTACCMLHGSCAEALAATWFIAVELDLHGRSGLGMCVFGQNVCSSLES